MLTKRREMDTTTNGLEEKTFSFTIASVKPKSKLSKKRPTTSSNGYFRNVSSKYRQHSVKNDKRPIKPETIGPGPAAYNIRNISRYGVKSTINNSTFGRADRLCSKTPCMYAGPLTHGYKRQFPQPHLHNSPLGIKAYTIGYE